MRFSPSVQYILLFLLCVGGTIFLGVAWTRSGNLPTPANKAAETTPLCDHCNVILVSLDTLSALHLPCYGYDRNTAPNLCTYAEKNVFFSNSYSQSSRTIISHFSLFTSLFPLTHTMLRILNGNLDEKYLTLAQVFRLNGYKTIYHGGLNDPQLPLTRGIERGFDTLEAGSNIRTWDTAYTALLKNAQEDKPTFLFLHTYAVHDPYFRAGTTTHMFTGAANYPNIPLTHEAYYQTFSPEFFAYVVDMLSSEKDQLIDRQTLADVEWEKRLVQAKSLKESTTIFGEFSDYLRGFLSGSWNHSRVDVTDQGQVEYLRALYDEQIYRMDEIVQKLLTLMDDPALINNTILIITADHGEEFMEHGKLYHSNNLYGTSTRVPLIIHIPGVGPKTIDDLVQGVDIYPTILALTGLVPQSPIEGIDVTGLINGATDAKTNTYLRREDRYTIGIQDKNFSFYYDRSMGTSTELYDLTKDPVETHNIFAEYPEKVEEFTKLLPDRL